MFIFIEQNGLVCLGCPFKRGGVAFHGYHLGDPAPAGLLGGRGGDLLPALHLLFQALVIRPGNAPGRGERHDFKGSQLRCLLDHMLQLVSLGVCHVDGCPDPCLRPGCPALGNRQGKRPRRHLADCTQALHSLAVADQHFLPCLQPQHLGMLGIFPGQSQNIRGHLLRLYKKSGHPSVLHVYFLRNL